MPSLGHFAPGLVGGWISLLLWKTVRQRCHLRFASSLGGLGLVGSSVEVIVVEVMLVVGKKREEGEAPGLAVSLGTPSWAVLVWRLVCYSPKDTGSDTSGAEQLQSCWLGCPQDESCKARAC